MAISFTPLVRCAALLLGLLVGSAPAWGQAPVWQTVLMAAAATGSAGAAMVTATVADASGNVYVAGWFAGTISLGGTSLTSAGSNDVFVAKWSPATQSFAWVQQAGGPGTDQVTALALGEGSVYVGGYFESTATFGSSLISSAGYLDAFVAKLVDAGPSAGWVWAQRAGGANFDQVNALVVSGLSVYAAGSFSNAATFGSATLTSAGPQDAFLSKLTDTGPSASFAWTQPLGGPSTDQAMGVAAQGGSIYVTGLFSGPATFGPTTLSTTGPPGLFIAKLADVGSAPTYTWVRQAGGTGIVVPNALVVQGSQVYVAGRFQGTATFGTLSVPNATTAGGAYDAFVAKLLDAGPTADYMWARSAGGPLSDYATALAVRGSSVFLAGGFGGTSSFGGTTLTSTATSDDAFVAKLTDAGLSATFAWAQRAGGPNTDNAATLAATSTAVYVGGWVYGVALFGTQPVGAADLGHSGFFTSLADATGLATASPAATLARATVFPNPTPRGTLATVQLPAGLAAGPATLTLLDAVGRVLRSRTVALPTGTSQATLDVAGLAPGVYALRVAVGEQVGTARLVVE